MAETRKRAKWLTTFLCVWSVAMLLKGIFALLARDWSHACLYFAASWLIADAADRPAALTQEDRPHE